MSTPYQRGAAFEHRVKRDLESQEWLVERSPASKSPYDLMCIFLDGGLTHEVALVQCKLRGAISKAEEAELTDVCEAYAAWPILAYTVKSRGEIHYKNLLTGKPWSP